jgi:plasmid maintenance system antidote protein VapI
VGTYFRCVDPEECRMINISEELIAAIRASGMTHYGLSKVSGVSPNMIDRFVSGERDIRLSTAAKLAAALKLRLVQDR